MHSAICMPNLKVFTQREVTLKKERNNTPPTWWVWPLNPFMPSVPIVGRYNYPPCISFMFKIRTLTCGN